MDPRRPPAPGGFADLPLSELLESVAARDPAPGGGCSAAWACALGASLVEMASAFTIGKRGYEDVAARMAELRARAGELRARALVLAERDAASYAAVIDAYRHPHDEHGRATRIDAALSEAAEAPLATAEAAAEVAALAAEVTVHGNPNLRGDARTGALVAEAASRAAATLVEINLADQPGDDRIARARELAQHASAAREDALA